MLFPNELNCWQICSLQRFHNAQKTPGVILCFFIKAKYDSCNQICRSALGTTPDIKNRQKWISSAPRNPCQPHTQPQALAWAECSIWHCQGDLPENPKHFLSEDADLLNGCKEMLPVSCFWQKLNTFAFTIQRNK